ncbi:hypothetical protein WN51_11653 [Melipona quadrifasciata]|uniref:Uncharacterized protein n=1 Tax=Melipona quadrifasciata TaxID=166423 RepID=A0A0N0BHN1_9HYME|nr:hypothetical protein WN51_11653 [Melipona quadrifasciata]
MGWDGMGWDGMGWDGMGWDGMGWDGMGWDGMGWDGMGWDEMRWDGIGWDGMGRDGMGLDLGGLRIANGRLQLYRENPRGKGTSQELLMAVGVTSAKITAFNFPDEEIPGIEGPVCAADFDDPLSEISLTITHVRSLSAGNVISDPTKLGSSFMRAPAAREYTPSGCCCSAVEDPSHTSIAMVGRLADTKTRGTGRIDG